MIWYWWQNAIVHASTPKSRRLRIAAIILVAFSVTMGAIGAGINLARGSTLYGLAGIANVLTLAMVTLVFLGLWSDREGNDREWYRKHELEYFARITKMVPFAQYKARLGSQVVARSIDGRVFGTITRIATNPEGKKHLAVVEASGDSFVVEDGWYVRDQIHQK